jgi:hypothetical protein
MYFLLFLFLGNPIKQTNENKLAWWKTMSGNRCCDGMVQCEVVTDEMSLRLLTNVSFERPKELILAM